MIKGEWVYGRGVKNVEFYEEGEDWPDYLSIIEYSEKEQTLKIMIFSSAESPMIKFRCRVDSLFENVLSPTEDELTLFELETGLPTKGMLKKIKGLMKMLEKDQNSS